MTPSPLTKAERAEIAAMMEIIANTRNGSRLEVLIERLLEAEAFWREAHQKLSMEQLSKKDGCRLFMR